MSGGSGPEPSPESAGPVEGAPSLPHRRIDWQYAAGFAVVILGLILVASYLRSGCECDKTAANLGLVPEAEPEPVEAG